MFGHLGRHPDTYLDTQMGISVPGCVFGHAGGYFVARHAFWHVGGYFGAQVCLGILVHIIKITKIRY